MEVTSAEAAELDLRVELSLAGPAVTAVTDELGVTVTDLIDHHGGGTHVVLVSGRADEVQTRLRESHPHPDRVVVEEVDWALGDLARAGEYLARVHGDDPRLDGSWVDERRGVVEVFVFDDAFGAQLASELSSEVFGTAGRSPLVEVRQSTSNPAVDGDHAIRREPFADEGRDTATHGSPLRGGLVLRRMRPPYADAECTSGFVALQGSSRWLTMAAHCYALNESVYQGYTSCPGVNNCNYRHLNPLTRGIWPGPGETSQADAAAVQIPGAVASNRMYVHPGRRTHQITVMQHTSQDRVGDVVCISGIRHPGGVSSEHCGSITSRFGQHGRFTNLRVATYPSTGGDSGAPIYSAHVARGLHKGSLNGSPVFSHIARALHELGLGGLVLQ